MTSDKARTNKKWTSSDKYRDNFDEIFGKKTKVEPEKTETPTEPKPIEEKPNG